jgi:hypothetical protein
MEDSMNEKRDWQFDFVVENITQEQANSLLASIIDQVEELDTVMGGGFYPYDEDEADEFDWSDRNNGEEGDEPNAET